MGVTEMADVVRSPDSSGYVRALCTDVMWIVSMWAVWAMILFGKNWKL